MTPFEIPDGVGRILQIGKKPQDIPTDIAHTYADKWTSFGDWLGTGTIATRERVYRNYQEAQQYAAGLGLKNYKEWQEYCKSKKKPEDIPNSPEDFYKANWTGWPDWLGYEEKALTVKKVKELLRDLISSGIIYQWDEAVLYSFLLRKGLLNLANRHSAFFKNLVTASRTREGKKLIEQYANSSSEIPPDLSNLTGEIGEDSGEIEKTSVSDLSGLEENRDPLDYSKFKTVEQILSNTAALDSISVDEVSTGRDSFYVSYSENEYLYLVLNYDKFSQGDSPNLILQLGKQKIDLVVLDEVHFTKIRNEEEISKRRKNLDGLLTLVRGKNPKVKVLGLSATPVVNNLRKGRSLLELLSGKVYDDVSIKQTIPNAVTLYEKLSTISIRELPKYPVARETHTTKVTAPTPPLLSVRQLKSNPLAIEKFLTDARIPEIVKLIDGQTIIYTEYVEEIIKKISQAVERAGHTYALYTGFDRSGLERFLEKRVQVLIASRPLSVGVDGLQHICNRLIINTLPWTNAQYQQLLGRLVSSKLAVP